VRAVRLAIPEVVVLETAVHRDARGAFLETWRADSHAEAGVPGPFAQDNLSVSIRNVLRGLHYQWRRPQGKLVTVLRGRIFDVAVDVRAGSPAFGRWVGAELDAERGQQIWIPPGFAHGFAVLTDEAIVAYKCTAAYDPGGEGTVLWNDVVIGIDWPVSDPILSDKDRRGTPLRDVAPERLPRWSGQPAIHAPEP
jgi:dTDP-4-dehydrorhamnose 3,5-epimerase